MFDPLYSGQDVPYQADAYGVRPWTGDADNLAFGFMGRDIGRDRDGKVSLSLIWEAAESPPGRAPLDWVRADGQQFVDCIAAEVGQGRSGVLEERKDGGQGVVFADWRIGLAYAGWLSPEFLQGIFQLVDEHFDEAFSPVLKLERAIDLYRARGIREARAERWREIMSGGHPEAPRPRDGLPFGIGEDFFEAGSGEIFRVLFNRTPEEVLDTMELPNFEDVRDRLDPVRLQYFDFAESLAAQLIRARGAEGHHECFAACRDAGRIVRDALDGFRAAIRAPG